MQDINFFIKYKICPNCGSPGLIERDMKHEMLVRYHYFMGYHCNKCLHGFHSSEQTKKFLDFEIAIKNKKNIY